MNMEESGWIKVDDLKPHPDNAMEHPEDQIEDIARSIDKLGWGRPITISKDLYILAGHGACKASEGTYYKDVDGNKQFFKSEKVPYKFLNYPNSPNHDDPEAIAYMLADNKLPENSYWNYGKLDTNFNDLKVAGFDVELSGFDNVELKEVDGKLNYIHDNILDNNSYVDEEIPESEPEFDESIADTVEMIKCPECGHEFPK